LIGFGFIGYSNLVASLQAYAYFGLDTLLLSFVRRGRFSEVWGKVVRTPSAVSLKGEKN